MKKIMLFAIAGMFFFTPLAFAAANYGSVSAPGPTITPAPGPAPNSGDGISDGSGWDDEELSILGIVSGIFFGPGPAPNSGDGIPDGSGFVEPPQGAK